MRELQNKPVNNSEKKRVQEKMSDAKNLSCSGAIGKNWRRVFFAGKLSFLLKPPILCVCCGE